MATPHAAPGVPVDLRLTEGSPADAKTNALVKTDSFEAIRLALPKGKDVCHHREVEGPVTFQCLEGRVALDVDGVVHDLPAGHWAYLPGGAPHTLRGVEDSLVLLTILFA